MNFWTTDGPGCAYEASPECRPRPPLRGSAPLHLVADRAVDAQIMGQAVPADQVVALAKAGRLLQDQGVEWPPLLTQVLHELAGKIGEPEPAPEIEPPEDVDL